MSPLNSNGLRQEKRLKEIQRSIRTDEILMNIMIGIVVIYAIVALVVCSLNVLGIL